MHKLLFVIFTLLITQLLFGQDNYQVDWYSADNNHLPQNSVKAIVKDKYDFIWFSTEDGLVRYDGKEFKLISNIKGITSSRMIFFWGSPEKDSIFIKNDMHEVILIHKRQAVKYNKEILHPHPVKKPYVYEKPEGVFGTHQARKYEFFKIVANNSYYIVGNDSIRHYNSKGRLLSTVVYKYPVGSEFFAVGPNLYLMQNNGYIEFSSGRFQKKKFVHPFPDKTTVYTNPIHKQAFISSGTTLYLIKLKDGNLTPEIVLEGFDITKQNLLSLYYDPNEKIIYLGSYQKALGIIKPRRFKTAMSKDSDGVYYATAKFTDNSIVTSTGEVFDSKGYSGKLGIKNTDKHMMAIDKQGNIWINEYYTLRCYYKNTNFKEYATLTLQDIISAIATGPDGRIWVCTRSDLKNGKISFIDPMKIAAPVHFINVPFHVNCMDFIKSSTILMGSERGLHIIDLNTKKLGSVKALSDSFVRSIKVVDENEIWVTTYNNGYFLYRDKKVIRFPLDKNKYLLSSHYIIEDNKGFFWIPTNKGLFQARKQDLYNYANRRSQTVYYHYYDKSEGFLSNEFNGGCQPCGTFLNNRTIFLPSIKGIVYFNPDNIVPNPPSGKLYIDEAEVDGKIINIKDTITLKRDFHRIKLLVSSAYYGNHYNQNIEFELEGPLHQHWTPLTDGQIVFSTLLPGEYTLRIRKSTGFGTNFQYCKVHIVIPLPFWQTGWFYVSIILLAGALILVATTVRVRYIKYKNVLLEKQVALQTTQLHDTITALRKTKDDLNKQVKVHKKLVKTVTHDIKSPLRFISLTGRYLFTNPSSHSTKEDIKSIYTSAQQLYNFVDNFLENAKLGDTNAKSAPYFLHSLAEEKIIFFRTIAQSKKISLFNSIPEEFEISINRYLLSIILHNLLDNAIKYTTEGSVVISAYFQENDVHIAVKDTGMAMGNDQIKYYSELIQNNQKVDSTRRGMGLTTVVDLLLILGGSMKIHSSKIKGTRITVIIPMSD